MSDLDPVSTDIDPEPCPGARRRGGRRPGGSESRQKILDIARLAFAANGYTGTSLRGIARDAGVDPSLIVQFFGSKACLFNAVVESLFDAAESRIAIEDLSRESAGEFLARRFVGNWERDEHRNPVISLMHAALADPASATMLRDHAMTNLALPVVERIGVDHPDIRAALLASQLIGFGLSRYVLEFEALISTPDDEIIAALADTLQHTCTAPLLPSWSQA